MAPRPAAAPPGVARSHGYRQSRFRSTSSASNTRSQLIDAPARPRRRGSTRRGQGALDRAGQVHRVLRRERADERARPSAAAGVEEQATTRAPLAAASSTARPKVSCGPGATTQAASRYSRASARRSATNGRISTRSARPSRRARASSTGLAGPSPTIRSGRPHARRSPSRRGCRRCASRATRRPTKSR